MEHELSYAAEKLQKEPIEIQALLLDYSANEELVLKAQIALMRYPEKARAVLLLYGEEPEYKEILLNYGEAIIPVIHYFLEHEVTTLEVMSIVGKGVQIISEADLKRLV